MNIRVRRWALISLGVAAIGLAVIGIVVPVLPTTPFLLLAAACFARSSDRFYNWLTRHRVLGSYIKNYHEHKAITKRARVVALVMLWAVIAYSALTAMTAWWLRAILVVIALAVSRHLIQMKTYDARQVVDAGTALTDHS